MSTPQVQRLCDYQRPPYTISHVDLTFQLDTQATEVTAVMQVQPTDQAGAPS